jgi:hypothetical protein
MSASNTDIPPLLPGANQAQTRAILGAMRAVAETGGAASKDDRLALASADQYIFGHDEPFVFDAIGAVTPAALATALAGSRLREDALKFLTVMAFIDGNLDTAKIASVLRYATALGIEERYLDEIKEAAQGRLQEALADMTRCNMESITGRPWSGGNVNAWLLPYGGAAADPALARCFETLGQLPADTFGNSFWAHFKENGYAFPGDPKALNATFSVPHDCVHVLTGYDTKPRGELLASTFTAGMHPNYPMAVTFCRSSSAGISRCKSTKSPVTQEGRSIRRNSGAPGRLGRQQPSIRSRQTGISGTMSRSRSQRCGSGGPCLPRASIRQDKMFLCRILFNPLKECARQWTRALPQRGRSTQNYFTS